MPNPRRERTITVSGKNGYVPILAVEQKAFRIEVYFSATNVGETNYYSYEWYTKRSLYGRFKIVRGEYTTKEKLVQYQNELVYSEEATLFELVKLLQCERLRRLKTDLFLTYQLFAIMQHFQIPVNYSYRGNPFELPEPTPINIPALQVDGIYYNMFPGCAGTLTVQTWYDDDTCVDVNNEPLTKDDRGKPPDPSATGEPARGTEPNVPTPTFPPNGTYVDPAKGTDVPTDSIPNPGDPVGGVGTPYRVTVKSYLQPEQTLSNTFFLDIQGRYGAMVEETPAPGQFRIGMYHLIGAPSSPPQGIFKQFASGGRNDDGATRVRIEIYSIVPL